MTFRRALALPLVLALCALGAAEVRYTVQPMTAANKLKVQMSFETKAGTLELHMPNWSPGYYVLIENGQNVADLSVTDSSGRAVTLVHPAAHSWTGTVAAGRLTVEYTVPVQLIADSMHYSGPTTYLYIVGRKEEPCRLTLDTPKDWKIAVGLEQVGDNYRVYRAPDYDTLADNPVTMGDFIELSYSSHGKPHTIALRGAPRANVDREKILRVCKEISDGQGDFFGGLPFDKYVWHFNVTPGSDGGGGLEHLTSTQISLAQGVGPRSISVCAHEYFHLWNVKRIRSRVLGPFDYTKLPRTGALYWLEGVTDYYASLLSMRYGPLGEADFLQDIVENTQAVRSNPARLTVSPYDSSLRVGEANNGRGNSNGYEISYYNLGWLVGLVLDIELRSRSGGLRSLDDAMRVLWQMCKDGRPGFEEGEIRSLMLQLGGPTMGDYFDKVVMRPGELPLEEQLAKIGLKLEAVERSYTDVGFDVGPMQGGTGVRVTRVRQAINQAVQQGDEVIAINGSQVKGSSTQELMASANAAIATLKANVAATMTVKRGERVLDVTFTPRTATVTNWRVQDVAEGDAAKLALRKNLYYAGKK
jgi:predicted metalloprotease with PDZ domain